MATADREVSKRERQKQRREEKLAEQRRQLARARRNRLIAIGLVAAVVLAALGFVIANRLAEQRAREENIAAAEARLEELGCTPITEQPDLGGGHLAADPASLAAAAPDALYPDRPATSGQHLGAVALSGVYDEQIDERLLVHNLEHGYVNVYYGPDADPAQVDELKRWARERIDGDHPKMVVAPYGQPLPEGANFASVAWDFRQLCGQFDPDVTQAFLDQHYNGEQAPERYLNAHSDGSQPGVLDPNAEEGPLLFPPLAPEAAPIPTDQPPGSSEAPQG
jgi:hypothetical protein